MRYRLQGFRVDQIPKYGTACGKGSDGGATGQDFPWYSWLSLC